MAKNGIPKWTLRVTPQRQMDMMSESDTCFGCKWLLTEPLTCGGGHYLCAKYPGVVLGAWGGLWADETDLPRPLEEDCYTAVVERSRG